MVGTTLLSLPQPIAVKLLIDDVLGGRNVTLLYLILAALLATLGLNSLMSWYLSYLSSLVHQRVLIDVRGKMYDHIHRLGPEYYNHTQTGDIMYRVLNDSAMMSNLIATTLSKILTDFLTLTVILLLMLYFDWRLSLLGLAPLPFFILAISRFNHRIRKVNLDVAQESSCSSAVLAESIAMLKHTQVFRKESYMSRRFRSRLDLLAQASMKAVMTGTASGLTTGFFAFIGPVLVLWYGSLQVIGGAISAGTLVAFYSYLIQVYGPIGNLANINGEIQGAYASLWRVFKVLNMRPAVVEAAHPIKIDEVGGRIEFKDVGFSYPDRGSILKGVSFSIGHGEKVAFVGPSGAGKTTVVDLLCRFYDPTEGVVRFKGHDLRELELKSLRQNISIVSQDTFLFDDTLFENIAFGGDSPTQGDIEAAAKVANIHDFITSLPDGYDTLVGERGVRLSGGQRQRIAIARAVLRNASVIILDEATSSVDSISERLIQEELSHLVAGRTAIIIAHRISAIKDADRIFVLDNGMIAAEGNHQSLLDNSELYRELFLKQCHDGSSLEDYFVERAELVS